MPSPAYRALTCCYKTSTRAKRLGDIVLNIDRFRLVILGNLLQVLLLLRISGRLGGPFGARGIIAKIVSGGIDISFHGGRTDGCPNGSRYRHATKVAIEPAAASVAIDLCRRELVSDRSGPLRICLSETKSETRGN
jgi:hypothetical protein